MDDTRYPSGRCRFLIDELTANLGDQNAEYLEVDLHPTLSLPLHSCDAHTVDGPCNLRRQIHENLRKGVAGRRCMIVQPPLFLDSFDRPQPVKQR